MDFGEVLCELRLVKSAEEIAHLRQAASIADRAMAAAVGAAGEGVNEREAATAASRAFLQLAATPPAPPSSRQGSRAGSPHGVLDNHRLERGDILHIELVPQVHSARLMRPTVIGAPSPASARRRRPPSIR